MFAPTICLALKKRKVVMTDTVVAIAKEPAASVTVPCTYVVVASAFTRVQAHRPPRAAPVWTGSPAGYRCFVNSGVLSSENVLS